MIIAQDHHAGAVGMGGDQVRQGVDEFGWVCPFARDGKAVPIKGKTGGICPIGWRQVGQVWRGCGGLQVDQDVGCCGVQRGLLRGVAADLAGEKGIAEVFEQQKAMRQVLRKHFGR